MIILMDQCLKDTRVEKPELPRETWSRLPKSIMIWEARLEGKVYFLGCSTSFTIVFLSEHHHHVIIIMSVLSEPCSIVHVCSPDTAKDSAIVKAGYLHASLLLWFIGPVGGRDIPECLIPDGSSCMLCLGLPLSPLLQPHLQPVVLASRLASTTDAYFAIWWQFTGETSLSPTFAVPEEHSQNSVVVATEKWLSEGSQQHRTTQPLQRPLSAHLHLLPVFCMPMEAPEMKTEKLRCISRVL